MVGKSKSSLIPLRGSVEDWGPGKHQRNLERKEAYARKMQEQASQGPPDFGKLLATGVAPKAARAEAGKKAPPARKPAPAKKRAPAAKKKAK